MVNGENNHVDASEPSGEGDETLSLVTVDLLIIDDGVDGGGGGSGSHIGNFVEISKFGFGFGAGNDFLDPSRVEYIDKRFIYLGLKLLPIDRATRELSKSLLIAFV